jgi:phosphoadenosine phosphosulfate reductase
MKVKSIIYNPTIFEDFHEQESIEYIRKFYRIAQMENLKVELGFSGGKDSIVCYDLCKRSGIPFTPVFYYAFESPEVVKFIRDKYPDVIIRKKEKSYFQLIKKKGLLPSNKMRFCCQYFKESNNKSALITGVRRQESAQRRNRKLFEIKNKKDLHKYNHIFTDGCTEIGQNPIALRPILYYSETEVWGYIKKYKLPYPALYDDGQRRCGCMMCPMATLKSNMYHIKKYPNLLPSFKRNVLDKIEAINFVINKWKITETDLRSNKNRYLLYWLSAGFRPSRKDKILIDEFLKTVKR